MFMLSPSRDQVFIMLGEASSSSHHAVVEFDVSTGQRVERSIRQVGHDTGKAGECHDRQFLLYCFGTSIIAHQLASVNTNLTRAPDQQSARQLGTSQHPKT